MSLKSKAKNILRSLWPELTATCEEDGLWIMGWLPSRAEYAHFHALLPPLTSEQVEHIELETGCKIPGSLREFYEESNGACLYSNIFSLYGLRQTQRSGSASDLLRQPFDILLENSVCPIFSRASDLLISRYFDHSYVFIDANGLVYRMFRDGSRANEWPTLEEWWLSEIVRLSAFFDSQYEPICEEMHMAPNRAH